MRAAEAILRGVKLVNLRAAIIDGGRNSFHLPKLVVARVGWARVRWNPDVSAFENPADKHDTLLRGALSTGGYSGTALVPAMPPAVRALAERGDVILWEAEWRDLVMPYDPALLRPFDGDVYELVAVWDLTDLERAILGTA